MASLCASGQSIRALALVVGGVFSACLTGQAKVFFPPPLAARPAVRFSDSNPAPLWPAPGPQTDSPTPLVTVSASWEGMSSDFLYEPPDPDGAAGPGGIIQTVNLRIKYWNKSGQGIWGPIALTQFWSSVGTKDANLLSDPRALFDRATGRFYVILQEADDNARKSYL